MRRLSSLLVAVSAAALFMAAALIEQRPALVRAQGGTTARTATPSVTPTASSTEHVVQQGENLSRIARLYGITVQDILRSNDIEDANLVYPGQVLLIPAPGITTGTATATGAAASVTAGPTATATLSRRPTTTPTPTRTPIPTARPIQATRTALARARTATATRTPTATSTGILACVQSLTRLLSELEERQLESGASILTPEGWTAREVEGLGGALPYLSDERESAIIYLVSASSASREDRLNLVPSLSGVTKGSELLREAGDESDVAVWDAQVGTAHRLVAGYVTADYTAVFTGSTAFCPSTEGHGLDEAEQLAELLQTVADSYSPSE